MIEPRHLHPTLLWLIALRAALVSVLFGTAVVRVGSLGAPPFDPLFVLIAFTYGLTALYAVTLRYVEHRPWLVDAQLVVDVALVSAFVLVTGGIDSPFTSLFLLPVVAASVVRRRRGGLQVAGLAAFLLVAMSAAQYAGLLPPPWLRGVVLPPLRVAVSTVGLNVLGFVAVGGLTGYLAERLRAADQHLARASLALADLRALNQTVIDSMTGGLATSAADGTLLSFNRAAEAICGRSEREVLGRPVRETLQVPDALVAAVERTAREGRTLRTDYAFTRPDGRVIELGLTMAPLVRAGRTVGSLFTFQDLTETKQLEREAEIQKRLAAIGQVAAGIAHEIRNPLASMSGSIQVLRTELRLEPEQAELMDIVVRESERLNEIIENFLSYARPRSPEPEQVDVAQLLRETALLLRNSPDRLAAHEVEVAGGTARVWHLADAAQLRQIVWNLASNGLRAMPGGGRLSLAAARASRDGLPGLRVEVSDEGVGIPASERDHIFQPFRSSFARGTGLGLAIVHRIVTDARGDIRVHSAPGAGTRVEIFLPDPAAAPERGGPVTPPDALVA